MERRQLALKERWMSLKNKVHKNWDRWLKIHGKTSWGDNMMNSISSGSRSSIGDIMLRGRLRMNRRCQNWLSKKSRNKLRKKLMRNQGKKKKLMMMKLKQIKSLSKGNKLMGNKHFLNKHG